MRRLGERIVRWTARVLVCVLIIDALVLHLPVVVNSPVPPTALAASGIADRDRLGLEPYWGYFRFGLGAGWQLSVNTFTGNLVLQEELVKIPGRGPALAETLTYNSLSQRNEGVGPGWVLANDPYLRENADGSVTLRDEDATNHTFTRNADGSYTSPPGVYLTLRKEAQGVFTITDRAQTVYRFENGQLVRVTDEKGNVLTIQRDTAGRPTQVTDVSGRSLRYTWDTSGRLTGLTDPANRTITLGYDASGRLAWVKDARGNTTRFGYDGNGRLAAFTNSKGEVTRFEYDASGRIARIVDARSTSSQTFATTFSYDATTRTTVITDPAGKKNTFIHNEAGNVIEYRDGNGNSVKQTWSANNLVKEEDAKGSLSLTYDSRGNVTRAEETLSSTQSAVESWSYDARNNPTAYADPRNNRFQFIYDGTSNLLSSTAVARREADANTYDAYGNLTSVTEAGAPTFSLVENGSFERVDSTTGQPVAWYYGGTSEAFSLDSSVARYGYQSLKFTSPSSATAYAFTDAAAVSPGQLLTLSAFVRLEDLVGDGAAVGLEFYDANGNAVGSEYSNLYSGTGNTSLVVTATAPAGAAWVYAVLIVQNSAGSAWFDGVQLESPVLAGEGHILSRFDYVDNSSFEWGGLDWYAGGVSGAVSITNETAWGGQYAAKVTLSTSGTAYLISERAGVYGGEPLTLSGMLKTAGVNGSGAWIQVQYYDGAGNYLGASRTPPVTGTTDWTRYAVITTPPAGAVEARVFAVLNASAGTAYFDNLKLVPRATTWFGYDAGGNYVTSIRDPLGNTTSLTYDAAGNLTSLTDPKGNKTTYSYDANNNLTAVTDAAGRTTWVEYDALDLAVTVRDPRSAGNTDNTYRTTYTYDPLQNRTSITDPLGRKLSYSYDPSVNLARVTNPDGTAVSFEYDAGNRLVRKWYSQGGISYTFQYDAADNLTGVTDDKQRSYSFGYDAANRLIQGTDVWGYRLDYTLDAAGNITRVTDSEGKTVTYEYGTKNQLLAVTDPAGRSTRYRYDDAGRVFEVIRGNGIKSVQVYDENGRLHQIADPGNPDNSLIAYWYDANGNIVAIDTLSGRQTFEYDALNRLVRWTDETGKVTEYAYDAAGNLVRKGSETFTYDAANQITNPGFSYDANGNLTSDGTYRYEYDAENRLVKVTRVADGSLVAQYEYDYRGLRIRKVTPSGEVRYHWDSRGRLVRESDGSGKTLARYIWNDRDELVAIEKDGQVYYPHLGHRGDVLAVTDAAGNRVVAYRYGPWGELLGQTGSFKQPWRYAGYYYDEETGLYYLKGRYYSPRLGRFLTKDPVLEFAEKKPLDPYAGFVALQDALADPQRLNPYTYARGNPVQYVDPDGRWANIVLGALIGAAGATWQYHLNHRNDKKKWIGGYVGAAIVGAATGALGGITAGAVKSAPLAARLIANITRQVGNYFMVTAVTGSKLSVRGAVNSVVSGIRSSVNLPELRRRR